MTKWKMGTSCAATLCAATLVCAQTPAGQSPDNHSSVRPPVATTKTPETKIAGCVVRDAANAGVASISFNGVSYRLGGRPDKDFDRYLGKRIEATGTMQSGTPAQAASGKTGVAQEPPKGQTATAGQKDVPEGGAARDNTTNSNPEEIPLSTDKGTTADSTGRFQVKTIRVLSPSCL